jgi:hypothetical protein
MSDSEVTLPFELFTFEGEADAFVHSLKGRHLSYDFNEVPFFAENASTNI